MNEPDELGAALLRLCRPFKVPTLQGDAGEQYLTVIEHPALLQQLREAVIGGTGPHDGGGTADPRTRLPFDPGAQAILENITRIAGTWYAKAQLRPVGLTVEGLLTEWFRWYRAQHLAGLLPEGSYARRVARIESWAQQIEALFDPPTVVPLDVHCPVCRRDRVVNSEGEHVLALVVEYWHQCERVVRAHARCRASDCAHVWEGVAGVATLMQQVQEADHLSDQQLEQVLTGAIPVVGAHELEVALEVMEPEA